MKTHVMRIREVDRVNYDTIADGTKAVETRAATQKYRDIQPGDALLLMCGPDRLEKTIKAVKHFDSIEQLIKHYGLEQVMPYAGSMEDAYAAYYSFPGYQQKIEQNGLMAFELSD